MTPNEMTRRVVDATLSLADVIDEENKALAQARVERVSALQDAKQTASDIFEARIRELKDNPDHLTQAAPTMRLQLEAAKQRLDEVATVNINALRSAIELNKRLAQRIAHSVDRQRVSASGYTKTGASAAGQPTNHLNDPMPISLNETL